MDCIYLEWVDSISYPHWVQKDDLKCEVPIIKSVGYVVMENDDAITISASISEYSVDSPMTIPKIAIKKRTILNLEEI